MISEMHTSPSSTAGCLVRAGYTYIYVYIYMYIYIFIDLFVNYVYIEYTSIRYSTLVYTI